MSSCDLRDRADLHFVRRIILLTLLFVLMRSLDAFEAITEEINRLPSWLLISVCVCASNHFMLVVARSK